MQGFITYKEIKVTIVTVLFSDLHVAFCMFDKDGDGSITVEEVVEVMKSLGFTVSEEEVQKMVNKVDVDGKSLHLLMQASYVTSI